MQRWHTTLARWMVGAAAVMLLTQCKPPKHEVDAFVERHLRVTQDWKDDAKRLEERHQNMSQRLVAAEPNARKANLAALDERIELIKKNLAAALDSIGKIKTESDNFTRDVKALGDKSPSRADMEKLDGLFKPASERVTALIAAATKAMDAAEEKLGGLERAVINVNNGLAENGVDHDAE